MGNATGLCANRQENLRRAINFCKKKKQRMSECQFEVSTIMISYIVVDGIMYVQAHRFYTHPGKMEENAKDNNKELLLSSVIFADRWKETDYFKFCTINVMEKFRRRCFYQLLLLHFLASFSAVRSISWLPQVVHRATDVKDALRRWGTFKVGEVAHYLRHGNSARIEQERWPGEAAGETRGNWEKLNIVILTRHQCF